MTSIDGIIKFVECETGLDNVKVDTDIFHEGVVGDDFHDLIEKYTEKYSVEMTDYLWYFHCDEEGASIGGFFIDPPNRRVDRIPITPLILLEFANSGKWKINYPEHKLPEKRYDIMINQFLVFGAIVFLGIYLVYRFFN